MIANVIDRRTNSYNVCCDVFFEPSQHNNCVEGSTKFTWGEKEFSYDELLNTTVVLAIEYANKYSCPVTMYLYDVGHVEQL